MPNMGDHGKPQCFLFQISAAFTPPDPSAATHAGMTRNGLRVRPRTVGKHLQNFCPHGFGRRPVLLFAVFSGLDTAVLPQIFIGATFFLGQRHGLLFHQQPLSFITLARPAEADHHRPQFAAHFGPARHSSISRWEKCQVFHAGATQT